jgi:DNA-directed RNA polymerase II subunit RPB1
MTIILKDPYCYNKEQSQKILNELAITTIKQITNTTEIFFDARSMYNDDTNIEQDKGMMSVYREFNLLTPLTNNRSYDPWVLRLTFDKMKMMERNIQMADVYYAIMSRFTMESEDIHCVYTDDNASTLTMRIQCFRSADEETSNDDQEDMISTLKVLEKTILNDIILTGIKGIKNASMYPNHNFKLYEAVLKEFQQKTRWTIQTDGTNLKDIFMHPAVNACETFSNDIYEIYETLGVEAARQAIFNEIYEVFNLGGAYVNSRHIQLLADIITNRGGLMSIDRHGINKSDRGPLAKCSFEETPDIIARAAIFGELDKIQSVSSNIMLGQEVPIGTGSIDILFDEEKYYEHLSQKLNTTRPITKIESKANERELFQAAYCENLF